MERRGQVCIGEIDGKVPLLFVGYDKGADALPMGEIGCFLCKNTPCFGTKKLKLSTLSREKIAEIYEKGRKSSFTTAKRCSIMRLFG